MTKKINISMKGGLQEQVAAVHGDDGKAEIVFVAQDGQGDFDAGFALLPDGTKKSGQAVNGLACHIDDNIAAFNPGQISKTAMELSRLP